MSTEAQMRSTQMLDDIVLNELRKEVPDVQVHEEISLGMTESDAWETIREAGLPGLRCPLRFRIESKFGVDEVVAKRVAKTSAEQVLDAFKKMDRFPCGSENQALQEELITAFDNLEYLGDAYDSVVAYIRRCWETHQSNPDVVPPCASIIQSSGFGKSQVLYQLALQTRNNDELGTRVLYTCNRKNRSSGFPPTTSSLREWLYTYPGNEFALSRRLKTIVQYADENWAKVGNEWIELFSNSRSDRAVKESLIHFEYEKRKKSLDQAKEVTNVRSRLVVLVVDSASGLLPGPYGRVDYISRLRKALIIANKKIRKTHPNGGILAILVDRNTEVTGSTSTHSLGETPTDLLPLFALTHNNDIFWRSYCSELKMANDEIAAYKFVVTQANREESMRALLSMGRPLWGSCYVAKMTIARAKSTRTNFTTSRTMDEMIRLAGCKLLVGLPIGSDRSYTEETMFGAASVLCRLGLSINCFSSLASLSVSHFLAFLSNDKTEVCKFGSRYSSDPILALGAMRLWCKRGDTALSRLILPKYEKITTAHRVNMDHMATGDDVARILLLLAMDTSVLIENSAQYHIDIDYFGGFLGVPSFLLALGGPQPPVLTTRMVCVDANTTSKLREEWKTKWANWKMGFCHFIELQCEPTEDTLWMLLGRRAAGVFPRGNAGADLLIPMFKGSSVSFILIYVEGAKKRAGNLHSSMPIQMHPSTVFSKDNALSGKHMSDVIGVYMNLEEPISRCDPDRYVYCDSTTFLNAESLNEETKSQDVDIPLAFCIRSICPWKVVVGKNVFPVVTEAVAEILRRLLSSRRNWMKEMDDIIRSNTQKYSTEFSTQMDDDSSDDEEDEADTKK